MKKLFIICMVTFFCAAVAFADPVDDGLPKAATRQVKDSTRQMLNQGFNTEHTIDMTRQMLANNYSQQHILEAHAILMNARRQGLQTGPIMNKAQEGLAKQVQPNAAVQAMERVRSRHAFASKQVKGITNDEAKMNQMTAILAGSMAAGMNHEDTDRIMQALHERTRNMSRDHAGDLAMQTFITTREMARLGMHSQAVGDSVCEALQQGHNAQEMHNMRNTMMVNSRDHRFDAGQHSGQQGMGGHDGGSSGGMGGGHDGGSGGGMDGGHDGGSGGGMGGDSGDGGGGMGGGHM